MSGAKKPKLTPYVPPTPAERRAEFLRRLPQGPIATDEEALEVARAFDTETLHTLLDDAKEHAARFKGRKPGSVSKKTLYIRALAHTHPTLPPKELYKLADPKRRGEYDRFRNIVSEWRSQKRPCTV